MAEKSDVARKLYKLATSAVASAQVDWGLSAQLLQPAPDDDELELAEDFRLIEVGAEEYLDVGGKVVVAVRTLAQRTRTGTLVEGRHYSVLTIEDGKVIDCEKYRNRDEALAAARHTDERGAGD